MWQDEAKFDEHTIAKSLARPIHFIDDKGYNDSVWAAATHLEFGWIGWVHCREKLVQNWLYTVYILKVTHHDKLMIQWPVKTCNPAFGCVVGYLKWHDDVLSMVYTEKHLIYACTLQVSGEVRLIEIGKLGDEWGIYGNVLACWDRGKAQVRRYVLPNLEFLPALNESEAIQNNLLRPIE